MSLRRREFLGAGLGIGLASARAVSAQQPAGQGSPGARAEGGRGLTAVPVRQGRITKLFKSPEGYPNAMALSPDGWWLAEQKSDNAVLVDWNGKLLKTVKTESKTPADWRSAKATSGWAPMRHRKEFFRRT